MLVTLSYLILTDIHAQTVRSPSASSWPGSCIRKWKKWNVEMKSRLRVSENIPPHTSVPGKKWIWWVFPPASRNSAYLLHNILLGCLGLSNRSAPKSPQKVDGVGFFNFLMRKNLNECEFASDIRWNKNDKIYGHISDSMKGRSVNSQMWTIIIYSHSHGDNDM